MNLVSNNLQPADRKEPRYLASTGRRRGRRLRAGKQCLMDTILPQVQIPAEFFTGMVNATQLYGLFPAEVRSLFLEIGFGTGTHLAHLAQLYPCTGIIGCEPYIHGVGDLLRAIDEKKLGNVRVQDDDARELLEKLPDAALDKVFILYPDPWPKARHHKRRLISQPVRAMRAR
ncbi:MAG: tRNA (guanosine(46)-N(7))-methyltransferase TrmB, partial [Alphaproteobacteria bacterium]